MNFEEKIKELEESPYVMLLAIMGTAEPALRLGAATYAALQVYRFARAAGLTWEQTQATLSKLLSEVNDKQIEHLLLEAINSQQTTN